MSQAETCLTSLSVLRNRIGGPRGCPIRREPASEGESANGFPTNCKDEGGRMKRKRKRTE